MSAIGRLSAMSRRIEPPTAESTPTKTAGTDGHAERERLDGADRAEQPDGDRVEAR